VLHRSDPYFRVIGEGRNPGVDRRPLIGAVARNARRRSAITCTACRNG
jgi:hypothetical protein